MRIVAAVVAVLLAAPAAHADGDRTAATTPAPPAHRKIVGILDVRFDGVSSTAGEKFESGIEEGLGSTEYWVATRKRMREILAGSSWSEGCSFGPCLDEVKRQTGADLIVDAYFSGTGSSYRFVVTLVDTNTGNVTAQVADHCDMCTLTEALDSAALATIGLVHGADGTVTPTVKTTAVTVPTPPTAGRGKSLRRTALLLVCAAVIAGGTAAYLVHTGDDKLGYAAGGAAGGLGVAGIAVLGISFSF